MIDYEESSDYDRRYERDYYYGLCPFMDDPFRNEDDYRFDEDLDDMYDEFSDENSMH